MFQLSYSFQSSLLTILFCIYCSCFIPLIRFNRHCLLFYSVYIVHVSTLLFALIVTSCYFILYILFMFQLSYSFQSSLLTILFCIYCSCFNSLYSVYIRFNRHCIYCSCFNSLIRLLCYHFIYIVHVSTLLFALIVTAYYFILHILFMFQLSYSLYFTAVYIVHISTLLFALTVTAYYFTLVYIVHGSTLLFVLIITAYFFTAIHIAHVSTLLFALIVTAYYFILCILFMFKLSYSF